MLCSSTSGFHLWLTKCVFDSHQFILGISHQFILGNSISHIITDVVLLGFPVPLIWKIHMRTVQKIFLSATFTVGSL